MPHYFRVIVVFVLFILAMYNVVCNINIFNKDEQNITAINGSEALMKCNILVNLNLSQYMNISWIKSPRQILTRGFYLVTENKRFHPQPPAILNTQSFNLKISPVLLEDEGHYRCNFIYGRKIFVKDVSLIVQVPPKIVKHPSAMVKVDEGSSIRLTCVAFGKPFPRLSWFLVTYPMGDLKLIPIDYAIGKYDTDINVSDGNLKIDRSNRNMRGTYRCVAENELGYTHWDTKVLILYPPEIHMANEIITQNILQNTVVVCVLSAYPPGLINWYFGNVSLRTNLCGIINDKSTKYCMYEQRPTPESNEVKVTSRLNLFSLTKQDFGTYTCQSQTVLGSASGSTQVKMTSVLSVDDDILSYDFKVFPKQTTLKSNIKDEMPKLRIGSQEANSKMLLGHKPMEQHQNKNSVQNIFPNIFFIVEACFVLYLY